MSQNKESQSTVPHIRVGTEESPADWDLDVYLDDERMDSYDADGACVELQRWDYEGGVLMVTVSWDHGLNVSAVLLDEERQEEIDIIPLSMAHEFENGTMLFVSEDERYAPEIELRKVY